MKASVITSAVLHGLVLTWAMVSLGAPESFKVEDFEAMPVDLVPVESITQMQQGDKKAPKKETSAPVPTTRPPIAQPAENAGDNSVDLKTPPVPNAKPSNSEAAAANSSEKPMPKTDPKPNDVKDIVKEETEVEQPKQVASIPPPKPVEVTPPKPEEKPPEEQAKPEEPPKPDAEALPDNVPTPVAKPQVKPPEPEKPVEKPPEKTADQPKTADTPTDKKKADKKQETAKSASPMKSDFNADEVAALLNKTDPSAGGAKRSTQEASLGAKKSNGGAALSQSEIDAVRGQISGNWTVVSGLAGANEVHLKVRVQLDQAGNVVGDPEVIASGGPDSTRQALKSSVYRAVMKSSPLKNLPADKYEGENGWNEMDLNFDASDLGI
ncbi:hypothetical protein [Rhizobium ruizarguesonis]|jgi:hypothetical protein|uniref:Cell division and transport-associated protein TolA n=1 Tax=Rhizobium ruizarguesonis TaxID=2081791 RepID=A0AB38I7F6_9HYPH|nr:hypothetical protein [Rhizobium ruizarguesonis]NEI09143.1 hypothetical protein [Rhizobium ruizarguesonis]NEI31263.1 hypothetical protein [Rhizobium ruizarguesonis]TAY95489.1 hypothetical protein ELH85_20920 [Rhizobium ruizarguesonis]TAZ79889.1 hypothetical protein ELH68_19830 [Rhizobium ruizarguesonis]TBA06268.1 hypothetical protein ELH64_18330 [Rhizobium ruizarguesonis]